MSIHTLTKNKNDDQPAADTAAKQPECTNPSDRRPPTLDEIQLRAYQIHLDHGGLYGYDLDDWLQAERELTERPGTSTKNRIH